MAFNQSEYFLKYSKEHYKQFKVYLKKEDFEKLELLLKEKGLTKAQFLRDSIENLTNKKKCI